MHPIVFKFFNVTVYSYGLFVAFGALLGMLYFKSQAYKVKLDDKKVYDVVFYVLISGLIGGRLFYVMFNLNEFANPLDILKIWEGGLVFFGGLFCGALVFILTMKKWHVDLLAALDIMLPALALAHAVGRIGCFCAGCCYGAGTILPWGVVFSDPHSLAPTGMPLHPTQLYSFLGNMSIFFILHVRLTKKRYAGEVLYCYLGLYGLFRFLIEFLRADPRGPVIFSLSLMQYVSLCMAIFGGVFYIKRKKEKMGKVAPSKI